jgi:hypothetical protein
MVKERPYIEKGGAPLAANVHLGYNTTLYPLHRLRRSSRRCFCGLGPGLGQRSGLLPDDRVVEAPARGRRAGPGMRPPRRDCLFSGRGRRGRGRRPDRPPQRGDQGHKRHDESHLVEVGTAARPKPQREPRARRQSAPPSLRAEPTQVAHDAEGPSRRGPAGQSHLRSLPYGPASALPVHPLGRWPVSGDAGGSTINLGRGARSSPSRVALAADACTACHDPTHRAEDSLREKLSTA